ncbi:MAG: sigma-70 family RNA polymerase sigma factor [Planctomycetes bacterium]|nr:sigma-70 family RNA polymerase sigma factor [Planctomycetota bacterium]
MEDPQGSAAPGADPIVRIQRNEPRAFEALVELYAGRLAVFFHRHVRERAHAEDLVQEVFLKIFRGASLYEPQGCPDTYVWRVARNVLIDQARAARARLRPSSLDASSDEGARGLENLAPTHAQAGPLETLERLEAIQRLSDALAALTIEQRLAFELGVLEALPYQQVGAILEIPVGTVKSRIFNAVRALKRLLPDMEEAPPRRGERPAVRVRGGPRGAGLGAQRRELHAPEMPRPGAQHPGAQHPEAPHPEARHPEARHPEAQQPQIEPFRGGGGARAPGERRAAGGG